MCAENAKPSLYDRLGGIYAIATVVDDFIDRIMIDPSLNANSLVNEAHHRVGKAGFKYLVTEMVGWATGDPRNIPADRCTTRMWTSRSRMANGLPSAMTFRTRSTSSRSPRQSSRSCSLSCRAPKQILSVLPVRGEMFGRPGSLRT